MAIAVECPHCGKTLRVKDELAGKKGKCPQCQQAIQVPAAELVSAAIAHRPAAKSNGAAASAPSNTSRTATPSATQKPTATALPATTVEVREQVLAALQAHITPPRVGFFGKLAALLVLLVLLLMPLVYLAVIGGVVYGMWWLATSSLGRGLPAAALWGLEALGLVVLICLLKPLVEPRRRTMSSYPLALDNEDLFRNFLATICQQLGTSPPDKVQLECSPRLSAEFVRGWTGLATGPVRVTLGLPIVACLTVDELAGLLARELALLRKSSASRITQSIRSINEWLWRSVYAKSRFDEWLSLVAERPRFEFAKLLLPLRGAKFVAQAVLFVPMFIANTVAAGVVQRAELDADRAASRLVGRQKFTSLLDRTEQIEFIWDGIQAELEFLHREQQLPSSLPAQLALRMLDMTPELCAALRETVNPPEEKPFDSRPSRADREAAIAAEPTAGGLACGLPAAALVQAYDETARKMTWDYYVETFGAQLLKTALVPVALPSAAAAR